MKLDIDKRNKKYSFDGDVEPIINKVIDNHQNSWKDKHKAKLEAKTLLHKQKLEKDSLKQQRENWFQKLNEEKRKNEELKIKERIRKEKQERTNIILAVIFLIILLIFCAIMAYYEK